MIIFKPWIDLFFPPICAVCEEKVESKIFCSLCWDLCAPLSREGRCRHCFTEGPTLCRSCKSRKRLSFPSAFVFEDTQPAHYLISHFPESLAPFALRGWSYLEWEMPDLIIAMPGAKSLAAQFSELLQKPMIACLKQEGEKWICDTESIEVEQILLVMDISGSREKHQKALSCLAPTFPKRGYLLTLLGNDIFDS